MLEKKWNNIAPEVPQDFHNKFEDTLKQIEQADSVDKKYKRKKSIQESLILNRICQGNRHAILCYRLVYILNIG